MVRVTCSHVRNEKMSVSLELCDYFSESIQALATNECLEQMFQKLKQKNSNKV